MNVMSTPLAGRSTSRSLPAWKLTTTPLRQPTRWMADTSTGATSFM